MARWSIRNYNVFIREARSEFGLTLDDARLLYREMRDTLDRPVYGVDVERQRGLAEELLADDYVEDKLQAGLEAFPDDLLDYIEEEYPDVIPAGLEVEVTIEYEEVK